MDSFSNKLLFFICFLSFSIGVHGSFISFKAYPSVLKANLTAAASMRCGLHDNPSHRDAVANTTDDVTHVTSIVITNQDDSQIVAQGSPFEAPTGYVDSGNLMVKGDTSGTTSEGYLELSWRIPSLMTLGEYICEVHSIDARHRHTVFRSALVLTREPPSLNDIVVMLQTQQQTIQAQQQTHQQEMLAQKQEGQAQRQLIQNLTNEISSLKQESASKTQKLQKLQSIVDQLITCTRARVAFMATMSATSDVTLSGNSPVVYDRVLTNTDQSYNPKTGEFTANISGVYDFNVNILSHGSNGDLCVRLEVNSNKITSTMAFDTSSSDYEAGSATARVVLKTGDVVRVVVDSGCAIAIFHITSTSNTYAYQANIFAGHLIHSDACLN